MPMGSAQDSSASIGSTVQGRSAQAAGHQDTEAKGSVRLAGVTKRFGANTAVDNVSLDIHAGEFVALLGPSGCGKTTCLRMIAGFEQPDQGQVLISGRQVAGIPAHKRDVNTVFQNYSLFPHMTVLDNVAFGPRNKGLSKDAARSLAQEMLEIVRLGEFGPRKPQQMSGGQQQRVALARALVNRPNALLLDEPLAALDLKLRKSMQIELKRIQREVGITFIFVTHDQEEALTMSDRIAVMSQGKVEQVGTPEEIYNQPATVFVAGFIGSANLLPATVTEVGDTLVSARIAGGAIVSSPRNERPFRVGQSVTVMLRPERIALDDAEREGRVGIWTTVTNRIFHGSSSDVMVELPDGTELVADLEADDGLSCYVGEKLWLSWATGSAWIMPEAIEFGGATSTDIEQVEAQL
jgi:spermidine/putrescine transport system ATP-binding protein